MSHVFLSHSSANNAEAIALRDWLISQGWDELFLDFDAERGLKVGERWQAALIKAQERCGLVILLVSPKWAASKWCLDEFRLAGKLNKRIFSVIIEPTPLGDLPAELTAEWQYIDLTAGVREFEATVTLPHCEKTATVKFSNDGLNRLRIGLMQSGLDPKHFAWPPEDDLERAPYRGLEPLQAADAGIFFGRDGQIVVGLDTLRRFREAPPPRLLVILGASGAGKSSYMRAGLLPRLARDDQHFLPLPVIRPDRAVITGESGLLASLEQALKTAGLTRTRAEIRAAIDAGAPALTPLLTALADARTPAQLTDGVEARKPPTLILPIDQAEELFLADGGAEADSFWGLLRGLTAEDAPALIALFTIRSDSYERLQTAKALEGMRQHTLSLAPMLHSAYADVIKGPAQQLKDGRALKIEEPLVDALLADIEAGGAKDALPLLAFTLERLYREHGGDGDLTLADYEDLGRVQGSIETAVEEALCAADKNARIPKDRRARLALLRRGLIPWLAGIDPETGAPRRSVARLSEIPEEARPLIDLLVEQRLLATDVAGGCGEVTIEPAHEALLRQWDLLRGWLVEDRALLSVLEGVKRASRDWAANQRSAAWLTHTNHRLADAERLRERPDLSSNLEPADRDYLTGCRESELAGLRKRRRIQATFGLLILLLATAGVAWWKRDAVTEYYLWHHEMGASVLAADKEKELASQPKADVTGFTECKTGCPAMVVVPAGKLMMGTAGLPDTNCDASNPCETPQHEVTIARNFAVSKTEVTIAQWSKCVEGRACQETRMVWVDCDTPHACDDRPVMNVGWEECVAYAKWLSRLSGKDYRLLSEAEWEHAARAGNLASYSFGDDESELDQFAWYSGKETHLVGKKKANAFGLQDMHGNVLEWVEDHFHTSYQGAPADGSAWNEGGDKERRMVRGGSWKDGPDKLRSASRTGGTLRRGYEHVGFRVARTLNP